MHRSIGSQWGQSRDSRGEIATKVAENFCSLHKCKFLNLYKLKDAKNVQEKVGQEKEKTKEASSSQSVVEVES